MLCLISDILLSEVTFRFASQLAEKRNQVLLDVETQLSSTSVVKLPLQNEFFEEKL